MFGEGGCLFGALCFVLDLTRFKAEISCGACKQPDVKKL